MAYSEAANGSDAIAPQSPVDAIREALYAASSLADRILEMRGRLVGHAPSPVGSAGKESPEPTAVFPQLEQHAQRIADRVREAHDNLSAIDRATGI